MYQIIGEHNKVNYGCIDEPVNFNYADFMLKDFFGKKTGGISRVCSFHAFNYIGIITDTFLVGIAAVDLGYMQNVFAYIVDYREGTIFEYNRKAPWWGPLVLPKNPDEHHIRWHSGKTALIIEKSHEKGILSVKADFDNRLELDADFSYSLSANHPLRVLNPSEPTRWTFTEKCAPLKNSRISVRFAGRDLPCDPATTTAVYDWSAGFMRRDTNWYWAAFSGITDGKTPVAVGLNLAALVNDSFFPENAFWINGQRTRVGHCIWEFNTEEPFWCWHIHDEKGTVNLLFTPAGERHEKINRGIIKTTFRQFFGTFKGTLKPENGETLVISGIHGFTELHRAHW